MIELDHNLTKIENLTRLGLHEFFVIEEEAASTWRNDRARYYKKHDDGRVFSVRTGNEGSTIVIRVN